jgi:hypothetical protein
MGRWTYIWVRCDLYRKEPKMPDDRNRVVVPGRVRGRRAATHELLLAAKAAQDGRLEPDGYTLVWNCWPEVGHAHLHVLPRFDDEPLAELGGRSAIKAPQNVRPDPFSPGTGRGRLFGPRPGL